MEDESDIVVEGISNMKNLDQFKGWLVFLQHNFVLENIDTLVQYVSELQRPDFLFEILKFRDDNIKKKNNDI